jgi:hypothetical protein
VGNRADPYGTVAGRATPANRPGLAVDHDPQQGARTRRRLLDRISTDRLLVQGFHFPFPGIGHAVPDGSGYRWVTEV